MAIEAVIFDIGQVLLHWDPEAFYDRRIGAARRRALFDAVPLHVMNLDCDRGADFSASVQALADAHADWHDEILMWRDNWIEIASPAMDGSVMLMRALKAKGVPVHALTNFAVQTFQIACAEYDFLSEFDHRFVSGHMKLIKPDPLIYEAVENHLKLPGAALLFIDDKPENIAAAEARGWHGHLFDRPEGLARRLVAENLLSAGQAGLGAQP